MTRRSTAPPSAPCQSFVLVSQTRHLCEKKKKEKRIVHQDDLSHLDKQYGGLQLYVRLKSAKISRGVFLGVSPFYSSPSCLRHSVFFIRHSVRETSKCFRAPVFVCACLCVACLCFGGSSAKKVDDYHHYCGESSGERRLCPTPKRLARRAHPQQLPHSRTAC